MPINPSGSGLECSSNINTCEGNYESTAKHPNNGMQLSSFMRGMHFVGQISTLTKGLEIIFNIDTSQLFRAAKDLILLSDEDVATRVTLRLN